MKPKGFITFITAALRWKCTIANMDLNHTRSILILSSHLSVDFPTLAVLPHDVNAPRNTFACSMYTRAY